MAAEGGLVRRAIPLPTTVLVEMNRWGKILRMEPVRESADVIVETDRPSPVRTDCRALASADGACDDMRAGLVGKFRANDSGTWVAIGGVPDAWKVGDWVWVD